MFYRRDSQFNHGNFPGFEIWTWDLRTWDLGLDLQAGPEEVPKEFLAPGALMLLNVPRNVFTSSCAMEV